MAQFLLALYDNSPPPAEISPEEIQAIISEYQAWSQKLQASNQLVGGQKLRDGEGRVLRGSDEMSVKDGPFSEAKEVLGGFYLIEAPDYEGAVRACDGHPHLKYGGMIEVREVEVFE